MPAERNLTPLMQMLRDRLLGRKYINNLRFFPKQAPRSPPPPFLPPGVHDKISSNYYYTRDARREVLPPLIVAENTAQKTIASGDKKKPVVSIGAGGKVPTPGPVQDLSVRPNVEQLSA